MGPYCLGRLRSRTLACAPCAAAWSRTATVAAVDGDGVSNFGRFDTPKLHFLQGKYGRMMMIDQKDLGLRPMVQYEWDEHALIPAILA